MASTRPVTADESEPLARFLANFPEEHRSQAVWLARLRHWWESNPAYGPEIPRGWVLVDTENIVGFIGNVPTHLQVAGRTCTAMNATTWRVLPEYRSQSMELMLALTAAGRDTVVFNTTPNEIAERIIKALHFELLPGRGPKLRFWPTSPCRIAEHLLGTQRLSRAFGRAIAVPVASATRFLHGRRTSQALGVRLLTEAGPEFDELWERTKIQYATTNVRRSAEVGWYCFGSPLFPKCLLGCYRSERLVGYLVAGVHESQSLRPMECIDVWTEQDDPSIRIALFRAAVRHAEALGCGIFMLHRFDDRVWQVARRVPLLLLRGHVPHAYVRVPRTPVHGFNRDDVYFVPAQGDAWV